MHNLDLNNYHYNNHHKKSLKWGKYLLFAIIGIGIGAGIILYPKVSAFLTRVNLEKENEEVMSTILNENVLARTIDNIQNIPEEVEEFEAALNKVVILENAYLDVPFVCQAPHQTEANWVFHEESCEEAALLQVKYYLDGVTEVDKQAAHDTIMDMIAWQEENFGEHRDIYANDMKDFIRDYYGYSEDDIEIVYDADIVDIKKFISAGYPVIVPIMGDILQNPYYPYPGYHMLTVIGYTPEKLITNDVGTRQGKDFSYPYDRFIMAMDAAGGDILIIKKMPAAPVEEVVIETPAE